jgi:hypothetical protein
MLPFHTWNGYLELSSVAPPFFGTVFKACNILLVSYKGWHTSLGHTLLGWLDTIMTWHMEEYFMDQFEPPWHCNA